MYVYVHFYGWNLGGWIWLHLEGIAILGVVSKGMSTWGAIFQIWRI